MLMCELQRFWMIFRNNEMKGQEPNTRARAISADDDDVIGDILGAELLMEFDYHKFMRLSNLLINSRRAPMWLKQIYGVNPIVEWCAFGMGERKMWPEFWFIVTVLSLREEFVLIDYKTIFLLLP